MEELEQISALLRNLLSPDKTCRENGQAAVSNAVKQSPVQFYMTLLQNLPKMGDYGLAQMSTVVLSNNVACVTAPEYSADLPHVLNGVLLLLETTTDPRLAKSVGNIVYSFARELCTEKQSRWPDVIERLLPAAAGQTHNSGAPSTPLLQRTAFEVIGQLCGVAYSQIATHFDRLVALLTLALDSDAPTQEAALARASAMECVASLVRTIDSDSRPLTASSAPNAVTLQRCAPLAMKLVEAVGRTVHEGHPEAVETALMHLADVADNVPVFFAGDSLLRCVEACFQLTSAPQVPAAQRVLAIEIITLLAEGCAPRMREIAWLPASITGVLLRLLLHPEVNAELNAGGIEEYLQETDLYNDDGNPTPHDIAGGAFDRLASALGGRVMAPSASKAFADFVAVRVDDNSPDQPAPPNVSTTSLDVADFAHVASWRLRYAALHMLSEIGEGCSEQFEKHLGLVTDLVIPRLSDPHPLVVLAALRCILMCTTEFAPTFQLTMYARIVPALLGVATGMDGHAPPPRIMEITIIVLHNFMTDLEESIVTDALIEQMVMACMTSCGSPAVFVRVAGLDLIGTLAESCRERFKPFFNNQLLEPLLQLVAQNPSGMSEQEKRVRGATFRALSNVCAVGAVGDTAQVLRVATAVAQAEPALLVRSEDPQVLPWVESIARFAIALGDDFAPLMPVTMERYLGVLAREDIVQVGTGEDEVKAEEGMDVMRLVAPDAKDVFLGVRTALMDEMSTVAASLNDILKAIPSPEPFRPYIQRMLDVLVPLMCYPYDDNVAVLCVRTAAPLVRLSTALLPPEQLSDVVEKIVDKVGRTVATEDNVSFLSAQFDSLGGIVCLAPQVRWSDALLVAITDVAFSALKGSIERLEKKMTKDVDDDDRKKAAEDLEEETFLARTIGEFLGLLLKHQPAFRPKFSKFLTVYEHLVRSTSPTPLHLGLAVLCDFVEHVPATEPALVAPYAQSMVHLFLTHMHHSLVGIRQTCSYGLGIAAVQLPDAFVDVAGAAVNALKRNINDYAPNGPLPPPSDPADDDRDDAVARADGVIANCLVSLMRIFITFGASVEAANDAAVLPLIINYIPVTGDNDEAPFIHSQLLRLASQQHALVAPRLGEIVAKLRPYVNTVLCDAETSEAVERLSQEFAAAGQ